MQIHHSADCRKSPFFPHCNCGADEAQARLEQLEGERAAIERLIEGAEEIRVESSTSRRCVRRVVEAQALIDVLAGRSR